MEQIARDPLRDISAAIVGLAEDPLPSGSATVAGQGGCHYLTIGRYCILYHIDQSDEAVTVLGVVEGPVHTLH
jgi:mRNA-degrading endonuclease RelE of RelBE toxin-antitoxin system